MDLAQLTLGVDSAPLKSATADMQKLREIALGTADSADDLNDALEETGKESNKLTSSIDKLLGPLKDFKGLIGGIFAGIGIKAVADMADTWSDLSARVGLAVGDIDNSAESMSRLSQMARSTYSSLSTTAESFIANSTALKEMGYNTQQQLDYTEALNSALVISGARAERAASVQNALSKAMALGKLSGEELNTVIASGGRVAEALAASLGVGTNKLRELGTQGKITSDVIYKALVGSLATLRAEAESMPATIGDGFTLLGNAVLTLVGSFDQAAGITATVAGLMVNLADGIMWVASHSDTLSKILWTVAPAMVAAFGPAIYASVISLTTAIGTNLVAAVTLLGTVIRTHPLMTLATVITMVISAMYQWRDSFPAIGAMFDWLWEKASFVIETIKTAIESIPLFSKLFGGGEVTVNVEADQAAGKISAAFQAGGTGAASQIEAGLVKGGATAAQLMKSAQEVAQARYEQLNGKHVQQLGKVMVDGGNYTYNQVTGAFQKSAPTMTSAVEKGGAGAGAQMEKSIISGGQQAGRVIYNSLESAFASLAHIADVMQAFYTRERTELAKIQAETAKIMAETRAIREGRSGGGSGGSSGGSTSGGERTLTQVVSRRYVSSSYQAALDQENSRWDDAVARHGFGPQRASIADQQAAWADSYLRASDPSIRAMEEQQRKQSADIARQITEPAVAEPAVDPNTEALNRIKAGLDEANKWSSSDNGFSPTASGAPATTAAAEPRITIVNVTDPQAYVDAIGSTAEGGKAVINVIKLNRTEIRNILGRI